MAEQKYAIPVKGKIHRFPGEPKIILPETGGWIPWIGPKGRFWRRRLKEGTIKVFDKAPIVKPVEVEETTKERGGRR